MIPFCKSQLLLMNQEDLVLYAAHKHLPLQIVEMSIVIRQKHAQYEHFFYIHAVLNCIQHTG